MSRELHGKSLFWNHHQRNRRPDSAACSGLRERQRGHRRARAPSSALDTGTRSQPRARPARPPHRGAGNRRRAVLRDAWHVRRKGEVAASDESPQFSSAAQWTGWGIKQASVRPHSSSHRGRGRLPRHRGVTAAEMRWRVQWDLVRAGRHQGIIVGWLRPDSCRKRARWPAAGVSPYLLSVSTVGSGTR